jgi:hypothetical protein
MFPIGRNSQPTVTRTALELRSAVTSVIRSLFTPVWLVVM